MTRQVHFQGGPLDGLTNLWEDDRHPFAISSDADTDGFYVVHHQVAGQRIGDLTLTADDVVARWHQRNSPTDFQVGDTVVVKATGEMALAFAPMSTHFEGGEVVQGWLIVVGDKRRHVTPDEIRVATPEELRGK